MGLNCHNDKNNYLYWKEREANINKFWGKGKLISEVAQLIDGRKSILEVGCGEGHLLSSIINLAGSLFTKSVGVDNNLQAIKRASIFYPEIDFHYIDITKYSSLRNLGKFDVILIVNVLHEIYSVSSLSQSIKFGKQMVSDTIKEMSCLLNDDGIFVIMDGLEADNSDKDSVKFKLKCSINYFNDFIADYRHLYNKYDMLNESAEVEMMSRDFTRFITKLRFVNGPLWDIEKTESYQYYTEKEFFEKLISNGFNVIKIEKFISNIHNWENSIDITQGNFPFEHIIIIGQKRGGSIK